LNGKSAILQIFIKKWLNCDEKKGAEKRKMMIFLGDYISWSQMISCFEGGLKC
jgi:hypothetical protein